MVDAPAFKPCSGCHRPIPVRWVTTDLGDVAMSMCPWCDFRKCYNCHFPDTTGRAIRCRNCGVGLG